MTNKPTVVSLFAGCGGLDLGFKHAGYEILWANDFNPDAGKTYTKNFGPHMHVGPIQEVDFSSVPKADIITGGFPCQDFSMIWKRGGLETERGNLYRYFVKAVAEVKPKIFVAENVKGLMTANGGKAMAQIMSDFAELGYRVRADLYNFAEYGAPQLRERVLIVGVREDLDYVFEKPLPTNTADNYVTAGQALKGVEKVPFNNEKINIKPRTEQILSLIPEGKNFSAIPSDSPFYVKGMISHVYRRLDRNKPSTTIIAGGGGGTWGYHFEYPRPLTNRERARLFGYPDDFIFEGSVTEVRRQIGNSVPPVAAEKVAKHLLTAFK
jgi:DNA (cytosine-5)-methyltransferase 1